MILRRRKGGIENRSKPMTTQSGGTGSICMPGCGAIDSLVPSRADEIPQAANCVVGGLGSGGGAVCVLWVRSYWRKDFVSTSFTLHNVELVSNSGRLLYTHSEGDFGNETLSWVSNEVVDLEHERGHLPLYANWLKVDIDAYPPALQAGFWAGETGIGCASMVPHWFMAITIVLIGAIPWLRWRFSLHTLLLLTTLIAMVLGIIVWLSRVT